MLAALLVLLMMAQGGYAQGEMELFVAADTIPGETARALSCLLEEALALEVTLTMEEETGEGLDALVFADCMPDLAVLSPHQALPWAQEGMMLGLEGCVPDVHAMPTAVLNACVYGGRLIAAPLLVHQRYMAVNARLLENVRMSYLLDRRAHPAWYPSEVLQLLDELSIDGTAGMEVWAGSDTAALEAFLQSVSGMRLMDEAAGMPCAEDQSLETALSWLEDMMLAGLIERAESRDAALERFIGGETALFIDWTDELTQRYKPKIEKEEIALMPYPALDGTPCRSFDLVTVCALRRPERRETMHVLRAVQLLCGDMQAQRLLGRRPIRADAAHWLPPAKSLPGGAALGMLFGEAVNAVMEGSESAPEAAARMTRTLHAMGR